MAQSTIQSNNKLVIYSKEIAREFVRENLFSPYMGDDLNAIIRRKYDQKQGGEQINLPLVTKLNNTGVGVGTLVGNEENIDNYGMRLWIDWARNAVVMNKAEQFKDSADVWGEAKPLLTDWMQEKQRDDLLAAFMALPSESAPANLGTPYGQTVNGLLYDAATATQKNTWNADNSDRVLYGNATGNYNATHATALANVTTAMTLSSTIVSLMKRIAMNSSPAVRPYRTKNGYEYYVLFCGTHTFRDLKISLATVNQNVYPREKGESQAGPLLNDGDLLWDGVIVRQVPEISGMVTDVWTPLTTAGASSTRVEPIFLCGQQAAAMCIGQMPKPTFRAEDDYGFITGVGIEAAYGVGKMFKKHPGTGSALKQWGVVTGFMSGAAD